MEFGYVDSLEYIDIDVSKIDFKQVVDDEKCEKPQKHVTFAPEPQIVKCTYNTYIFENNFKLNNTQPISILKKTDYKYSKFNQYMKNIDDVVYLFLIISMLAFFDKFIKFLF